MPAGDASRTWFSEMIETLRQEWKPENAWEQVIALRDRLDAMLKEIRFPEVPAADDVVPCLQPAHTAGSTERLGSISYIRAWSFWSSRCGASESLEKRWAKHRKETSLDRNGKPNLPVSTGSNLQEPDRHSHDPT